MSDELLALGIVEVATVCARQQAINLDLFETLGALATSPDTAPGVDQQLFARASHRHAWHAELWAQRAPLIPAHAFNGSVNEYRGALDAVTDAASYRSVIREVADELGDVRRGVGPLLDPSTDRVIELVLADLAQI